MDKYKLSGNVKIITPGDQTYVDTPAEYWQDIPVEYRQGYYLLSHKITKKEYLINETIKYFLDKFLHPKTPITVLEEIAFDVSSDVTKIEKGFLDFFTFLCQRRILVSENLIEHEPFVEPLYKAGDYIGNLCVLEVLANKPYLDLYVVTNIANNRTSVLKLLNRKKVFSESLYHEQLMDLQREYRMLKRIEHIPFISQAYAFENNHESSGAYIELEHIKGSTLFNFLTREENANESGRVQIIRNILQAFSLLHQNNLIHGDIHPRNILVTDSKSIKVIDLALSKNIATEKNEVVKFGGVAYFMPPERINVTSINKFTKEPDLYSDVYQLGLIIYFILYSKLPFTGFVWEEVAKNIKETQISCSPIPFLDTTAGNQLIEIIYKCLSKNPVKRYQNAGEILHDFEKIIFYQK